VQRDINAGFCLSPASVYHWRDAMSVICIQIQPSRAPGIDFALIRDVAAQLGSTGPFTRYGVEEDPDHAAYINLYFEAPSPVEAWPIIRSTFYEDAFIGGLLQKSSIVTCQGLKGWDDYLLLHHFDPEVSRDQL
jgi:hypothetical protein